MMNFDVLHFINFIIISLFPVLYITQNIYTLLAIFIKPKRFFKSEKLNSFAYIVCAHNEEKVIGNLIDSIKKQDYPQELIHIFVVCDNCSDNTALEAKKYGAKIINRNNPNKIGKCYALDIAIKTIINDYQHLKIDACMIFDADNLVSNDYTRHMNDTLNAGYLVATSYRNSKNFNHSLISGWASVTFLRECEIIHKARSVFNIGTYVSGTGFYIAREVFETLNGWPFDALIEDIEFSIYCANNKINIGYNYDAVFYDEQTEKIKDAYRQRLRWCRGNHQCFIRHWRSLIKNLFVKRNMACFELFTHTSPIPAITLLWLIIFTLILAGYSAINQLNFIGFLEIGFYQVINYFILLVIIAWIQGAVCVIKSRKRLNCSKPMLVLQIFLFPFFMSWLLIISTIALFKRVKWTKIDHHNDMKIEDMRGINNEFN